MANYKTWTMKDFAEFLQVSTCTLKRYIAKKRVPAPRKIGTAKRWDYQELMQWWEAKGEEGKQTFQPVIKIERSA